MPLGLLLAADERPQLRQHLIDDAEVEREREADRRPLGLEQQLLDLAPDPLGRQIVERDAPAQRRGVVVERELEARGKLHRAQHAQAVVAERRRIDGAQDAALEIGAAVERVFVDRRSADPTRSR